MLKAMESDLGGKLLIIAFVCLISANTFSQNITNTLGASGSFIIKDESNNYLILNQSTGQMNILGTLRIENTTDANLGVIFKGADRFIHDFRPAEADGFNTFVGTNSGNFEMSFSSGFDASYNTGMGYGTLKSLTTGSLNTALGSYALNSNLAGNSNTALGHYSLFSNTTGNSNTAVGVNSLSSNTTGEHNTTLGVNSLFTNTIGIDNTASGFASLQNNTTGSDNTALGYNSLFHSTTGSDNTASGSTSLFSNTIGFSNTASGAGSLALNTTGSDNTALGYHSLFFNTTGSFNTAIGIDAGSLITTGSNNIAIGNGAQVPSGTNINQVRLGNTGITYAGIQVSWSITSDRRWKSDIEGSALGLNFISKLNPVSYTRNNDEKKRTEYGLIAQEVEEVLKESGVENAGMLTVDNNGRYELRYNDLLAPMIKAIQELKNEKDIEIAKLKTVNDEIKETNIELTNRLTKFEQIQNMLIVEIEKLKTISDNETKVSLGDK